MSIDTNSLPPSLKPRKQPAQARAAYTVGVILEAAARILDERGPCAYTTNAIAERAGVSIGSLYQYFPNKHAITVALVQGETDRLLAGLRRASTECHGSRALHAMIAAAVSHQLGRPRLARFLDEQEEQLPHHVREASVAEAVTPLAITVLEQLHPACPEGLDVAANDVMAITRALTDAAGTRYGESNVDELARKIARATHGYLGVALPNGGIV